MNVILACRDHGPVEVAEINEALDKLGQRQSALLARRAVLEQLIAIAQAHDAPTLQEAA